VIIVGIDDTDIVGSPGTNQLARAILKRIDSSARDAVIIRHQLFFDPRVPYTSKNGSASIQLPHVNAADMPELGKIIRKVMADWFVEGSDPGLCMAGKVTEEMKQYGLRCKDRVITQEEARDVAVRSRCCLEGLGGTNQGIVGALAGVGLVATGDDGRVVHLVSWPYPDDAFSGPQSVEDITARGVHEIRSLESGERISEGPVDIGKHLRPNWRDSQIVLYVEAVTEPESPVPWRALKIP
jgi:tRNA(Ile2) C34 agmatinyltransferase TiaS